MSHPPAARVPSGWQPIKTAPHRQKVIVSWLNALGKRRTTFAVFYDVGELDMADDVEGDENGKNVHAGWYEEREAGEAESWPLEEILTHWMPLPAPPGAEEPAPPVKSHDTYRWGETMTQYAVLGIGVEAWVELQDIEKRGIAQRNNDRSVMSINWRTFRLVMAVLRAIRLEDFEAARRLGAEDPVSPSPAGGEKT